MNGSMGSRGHPALTDSQTGLPNQLHFETVFEVLFAAGVRGVPLTLLFMEIDGYLRWARESDPEEVERVLRTIGSTLRPAVRRTDLLARVGETRFAACLLDCNLAGAVLVADRIDGLLDPFRQACGLSFSQGGAAYDMDMRRPEDLAAAAQAALEAAQRQGPDKMEFHR